MVVYLPYLSYQMCCQILRGEVIDKWNASDRAVEPRCLVTCYRDRCDDYYVLVQRNIMTVCNEMIANSA